MYPMASLALLDGQHAQEVAKTIGSVTVQDGSPLFRDLTVSGRTVQFGIALELDVVANGDNARLVPMGTSTPMTVPMATLGVNVRERLGGSNTAQHVPEGIGIAYGRGVRPDQRRERVDLLDVAPSILTNLLGVSSPPPCRAAPRSSRGPAPVPAESVSH